MTIVIRNNTGLSNLQALALIRKIESERSVVKESTWVHEQRADYWIARYYSECAYGDDWGAKVTYTIQPKAK